MITREELRECEESVYNWTENQEAAHGLFCDGFLTPIPRLAMERGWSLSGVLKRLDKITDSVSLHVVESMMPRNERQVLAEAMFDWTVWTLCHGLGPGIMTALKNGHKQQVLDAIEHDLAE